MDGGSELRDRHAAAIAKLLARDNVVLSSRQFVGLLAHMQTNVGIQKNVISALASIAAGAPDWDALEKAATLADQSAEILNSLIFEVAEAKTGDE